MKWSRFTVLAEKEEDLRCLLYNTFHDSQIICDDRRIIHELKDKLGLGNPLSEPEQELASQLKELGFITDDDHDEKAEFLDWFEEKVRNNFKQLSCLILTSRTCNLRCPYCFEKDVLDRGLNMKEGTARQVIAWNKKRIELHHPEALDITFFGGEPLMNIPILEMIAHEMHDFCETEKVGFGFGIITNGVLLTPQLVLKLKAWGMKWVKITLDGDAHEHDQLRVTKSGKGTFDRIWKNLEAVRGLIPIYIGGNFDPRNEKSLERLVDKLDSSDFRDNIFSVEFKPIQDLFTSDKKQTNPIRTDLAEPAFSKAQIETMMKARHYIQKKKLPSNDQVGIGPCELHRKSFFGIDMNGKLYKCSAMVGREEFSSGDIWAGEDAEKVNERMGTGIRPWKDCGDCAFIPVCAGGCKAVGYSQSGDFTVGSCDKPFFKRMVGEMFERNLNETAAYSDGLDISKSKLKDGSVQSSLVISTHGEQSSEGAESFAV